MAWLQLEDTRESLDNTQAQLNRRQDDIEDLQDGIGELEATMAEVEGGFMAVAEAIGGNRSDIVSLEASLGQTESLLRDVAHCLLLEIEGGRFTYYTAFAFIGNTYVERCQ